MASSLMGDHENLEKSCRTSNEVLSRNATTTPPTSCTGLSIPPAMTCTVPDGGWRAWTTVLGAFVALFCTFGQMFAFGTFQLWYSEHQLQRMEPSTISWIGSIQLWIFFAAGGPIGRAFDIYGPRPIMTLGTATLVLSIMMTSISNEYYQYILGQGILFGLGVGMIFYPSLASVSTHFSKYRASALGIAGAGSCLGGVIYPIMFERLLMQVGFGWSLRISGFLSLACCAFALATVNSRLPATRKSSPWIDTQTFKDKRFTLLASGCFLVALGLYIPLIYIDNYAKHNSIAPKTVLYTLAVMNAGGVLGRIVPAILSDVFGCFNILFPSAFFSGLSCLVIWLFSKNLASIMVFCGLYGFLSGAFISVINPCIAQISEIRWIGTRIGMFYSLISLPALVGGPIGGAMLAQENGSYTGMIAFSGTVLITGSFFIFASKLMVDSRILARI